jgi:hypothetical protein
MQAAAKLGITISISQVGSDAPSTGTISTASPIGRTSEWQPAFAVDEDGLLHQLRTTLIHSLDACLGKLIHTLYQSSLGSQQACVDLSRIFYITVISFLTAKLPLGNPQQSPQAISLVPLLQECVDAITEHQRLSAIVKGEWGKGLLPHSSVRADYTVQRIRGNLKLNLDIHPI